ncbi:uncharacterized protein PFL1_01078 [Pseudozyma flocculosa PF-1]|uniref:uncharacterized protein n=1 Tax=Pseudozyma flocculosa PF-1 TaxID=1277687 RepID=UPI0004561914|nr:uncharacterized protein PFL1_01078 [Pseudozyma flocculosa PF-1]EPQ31746.1 hypothetical protein PFL1_01078 [Pseudozyma flocculosa PF-1]
MIDPHHIGLGLGRKREKAKQVLGRKVSDSSSKATTKQQQSTPRSASASQSDVPPLPISTWDATSSFATGSTSTSTRTRAHRNPELEYFKQQNALNNELTPRTSDFFSKRRTSVSGPATSTGVSTPGASMGTSMPSSALKPGTSQKVRFQESEDLRGEPLPVRLGLAPPSRSSDKATAAASSPSGEYKAKVGHGYYFCIPPPSGAGRNDESSNGTTGQSVARHRPERRRDTGASEGSTHSSSRYSIASGTNSATTGPSSVAPTLGSPTFTPDSPMSLLSDWNGSGFDGGLTGKGLSPSTAEFGRSGSTSSHPLSASLARASGRASSTHSGSRSISGAARSPEPSCYDPSDYFVTRKAHVGKGKVHEFKHHAFSRSKVPYWYGYDTESIEAELDVHLCTYHALNGSHILRRVPDDARPSRVLDLGCGVGIWCVDMAREWPQTEFVGLDVCPIQTPMATMRNPDLEQRVTWVVANFLERLPFPDNSFDFVHMRYLGVSIPEDKWADIIAEVERVLAPGGKVEILENNFTFYGRIHMVDAEELFKLQHGRPAAAGGASGGAANKAKLPQPVKMSTPFGTEYDVDAIQVVVERTVSRRFINPSPLSVIPSMLLTEGLTDVAIGNPRHIPLHAESSRQRAMARARKSASNSTSPSSSDNDEKWKEKYTSRSQIGQPLNSTFHIPDSDIFRALGFLQIARRISGARELIWSEADEEKQQLLRVQPSASVISPTERLEWDAQRSYNQGHPAALKPFAHPWKTKMDFYKDLDMWLDDMVQRADMEGLIEKHLGWNAGSEELTVQGRKQAERLKKLNDAAAMPVGLSEDIAALAAAGSLAEDRSEPDAQLQQGSSSQQEQPTSSAVEQGRPSEGGGGDDDATLGRSSPLGFSVATSQPYHEAPGRMQTTRSGGGARHGGADDEDQELLDDLSPHVAARSGDARSRKESSSRPTAEGKRRKSARPTSSGGVGIAFGGVAPPRQFGRPGMMGEANLYGNLFMAGGQSRSIPVTAPELTVGGTRTPSQRAAAEFAKKKGGSSGGGASVRSGSSASTGKTAKTTDDRSLHGSVGSSIKKSPAAAADRSPDVGAGGVSASSMIAKDTRAMMTLSEPAALLLNTAGEIKLPSSPDPGSAAAPTEPSKKITAANVFNIPPASSPPSQAGDRLAAGSTTTSAGASRGGTSAPSSSRTSRNSSTVTLVGEAPVPAFSPISKTTSGGRADGGEKGGAKTTTAAAGAVTSSCNLLLPASK